MTANMETVCQDVNIKLWNNDNVTHPFIASEAYADHILHDQLP